MAAVVLRRCRGKGKKRASTVWADEHRRAVFPIISELLFFIGLTTSPLVVT